MSIVRFLAGAALGTLIVSAAIAQSPPAPSAKAAKHGEAIPAAETGFRQGLEPRAVEILKATSARLAAAQTMSFTAVVSYEGPSLLGPPLIYTTKSEVAMRRPDKLKVITLGDGPPSEFYYDGKTMMAYAPVEDLIAVADAPPSIDATLKVAFDSAAIYFPFTDLIVADPYKDLADGLTSAFYIGQSQIVGDTTTDMVGIVTDNVFSQIWIGAEDKLPRRMYAVYLNDPARLRHVLEISHWQLDGPLAADAFGTAKAAHAQHIAFKRPDAAPPPAAIPPKSAPASAPAPAATH
jgi:hypothetical protein